MWRNPKYPQPDDRQQQFRPPVDDGVPLVALPRNNGQEELRVGLKEYQGNRYVSLRVWGLDPGSDSWFPVRGKGCSVRLGEAEAVAEALRKAITTAAELRAQDGGRPVGEPRDRPEPKWRDLWGGGSRGQGGSQKPPGAIQGGRRPEGRPRQQGAAPPRPDDRDGSAFDEFSE
jgi:hypothetical protein